MVAFADLFNKFMLIGLIVFCLFAFAITFQSENQAEDPFIGNSLMNDTYENLQEDLTSYRSTTQTQKDLFESENPVAGFGSILLFSIISSGKVFNGMIVGVFNTIIKLPVVLFGLDPIILSILITMLGFAIIFGVWRVLKLG